MRPIMVAALLVMTPACAALPELLAKVVQSLPLVSSLLDVADKGSQLYLQRHPNLETQQRVEMALFLARQAVSELHSLEAAIKGGEEVPEVDIEAARWNARRYYQELRTLLIETGITDALPPAGGAENEAAPRPKPFYLPPVEAVL